MIFSMGYCTCKLLFLSVVIVPCCSLVEHISYRYLMTSEIQMILLEWSIFIYLRIDIDTTNLPACRWISQIPEKNNICDLTHLPSDTMHSPSPRQLGSLSLINPCYIGEKCRRIIYLYIYTGIQHKTFLGVKVHRFCNGYPVTLPRNTPSY